MLVAGAPAGAVAQSREITPAEAVRAALAATEAKRYAYAIQGRFRRSGEWAPPDLLTARIGDYRSARRGGLILVKGLEGIWKTPSEHIGETSGKPSKDLVDALRILEAAAPPHALIQELLAIAEKGSREADDRLGDVSCRVYTLPFATDRLRKTLEAQMARETERGELEKPETVVWSSARGRLRVHVDAAAGTLIKAAEQKSVRITYGYESKVYKTELIIMFSAVGSAELDLAPEVGKRLGLSEQDSAD